MAIFFKDSFKKAYAKRIVRNPKLNKKLKERLEIFEVNPRNSLLKTHKLSGEKKGLSAFSVTGDYRVVYYQEDEDYYLIDVGTHNQVY